MNTARSTAVVITAKDAATTAGRAISSALAQHPVTEVIFVDDGSRDNTSEVAASVDDGSGRLKIIRLQQNRGPSHGRNLGIDASSAPFVCILDADDYMSDDRLDKLFDRADHDWDLVADDMLFVADAESTHVLDRLLPDNFTIPCELTLSTFAAGNLPRKNRYRRELGFLKPLIRRSFLTAHGLRYDERLRLGEDFLLYAWCLIEGARFRIVEACGYYAIEHRESLSGSHTTDDIAALLQALLEFEQKAASAHQTIGRMPECTRSVRNNLALRRALDAKRKGGWSAFFAACRSAPASVPYIISELTRAKVSLVAKRL